MDRDVYFELDGNTFLWSVAKAQRNLKKHGIRFEDAASAFSDPLLKLVDASRTEEAREAVIGFDAHGRLLFVVHIEIEGTAIRLISARKAEPDEEVIYAE